MQDLWGKPGNMKKGKKGSQGKIPSPFSKSNALRDMKTSTLSDKGGASAKVFKSMGF